MLRIEYFDKNRFMKQVAASRGSVILHLDNGSTCDLNLPDHGRPQKGLQHQRERPR